MLASIVESGGIVSVIATSQDDTVIISSAQPGETQISINHTQSDAVFGQFLNTDISRVVVYAGDGDDLVYSTARVPTEISGQGGDDRLEGGFVDDIIRGGNGNDILFGKAGDDLVNGNEGNDNANGGSGNDVVLGGNTGNDFLFGGNGDDLVDGQSGSDTLYGGAGNDRVFGFAGNDFLHGGAGNDTLVGHGGNDTLQGEVGDDVLVGSEGDDFLLGQDGNDTLRGKAGNDRLVGGSGSDALHGDEGEDELLGQGGDDILLGGEGNDTLYGRDGADTLRGDAGNDQLYGGTDNDLLLGNDGADLLRGDGGDDTLRGGDGDDALYGLGGADAIYGDAGDDLLDAGGDLAADVLTGGRGVDRFDVLGNIGSGSVDAVTDRAGFETYNGYDGPLTALAEVEGSVLTVRGLPSDDKIQIFARNGQDDFELRSEHQILGTYSTSQISEIVINSGSGNDLIDNSNRSIIAMRVNGGDGDDTIYGGRSDDILVGGDGNDTIKGHDGEDQLSGSAGDDLIFGGDDDDEINGGAGNDRLYGESDDDTLRGGFGDDELYGGSSNDLLFGDAGGDEIFGGSGDDALFAGTDIVEDVLWGNSGNDTFNFVDGIDNVRDKASSEATTAAVAESAAELGALTSEVGSGVFSRSALTNFASGGSEAVQDGFHVVTIGERRSVFEPVAEGFQMLGDFSSELPLSAASAVVSARASAISGPLGSTLGDDLTVSLVPSFTLRSEAGSALMGLESAFVANGNGATTLFGGANFTQGGGLAASLFNSDDFVTNFAARTITDLVSQRLGASDGNAGINAFSALQSDSDNPVLGAAVSSLLQTSFVKTDGGVGVRNEIVLITSPQLETRVFNLDGENLEEVVGVIRQEIAGGRNFVAGYMTLTTDGVRNTKFFGPDDILGNLDPATINRISQANSERIQALDVLNTNGLSKEERQILFDLSLVSLDLIGIADPTPVTDGTVALIEVSQGNFAYAGISVVSMLPWLGDLAKAGKAPRLVRIIVEAVDYAATNPAFAKRIEPYLETFSSAYDLLPQNARDLLATAKAKVDNFLNTRLPGLPLPGQSRALTGADFGIPDEALVNLGGSVSRLGGNVKFRIESITVLDDLQGQSGDFISYLNRFRKIGVNGGATTVTVEAVNVTNARLRDVFIQRYGAQFNVQRNLVFDLPIN